MTFTMYVYAWTGAVDNLKPQASHEHYRRKREQIDFEGCTL